VDSDAALGFDFATGGGACAEIEEAESVKSRVAKRAALQREKAFWGLKRRRTAGDEVEVM
jgi:hypothetical protein